MAPREPVVQEQKTSDTRHRPSYGDPSTTRLQRLPKVVERWPTIHPKSSPVLRLPFINKRSELDMLLPESSFVDSLMEPGLELPYLTVAISPHKK